MFSHVDFGYLTKMSIAGPNDPPSTPTLSAVAKLAGVSSITVSRVVRLPNLVAPETRGRVEAAMRELGYVPNLVAGSLASSRTSSVGVLVPTIANSIFADTVQGLSDELEPLGYAVILAQSRYDDAREDHMLAALLSRRPEAIIMVGSPATEDGARLLAAGGHSRRGDLGSSRYANRRGRRIQQLRGRRGGRAASCGARPQEPRLHRRRRSPRHAPLAWIQGRKPAGRREISAPPHSGAQRIGQRGRARRSCPVSTPCSQPTTRMPSASCPACERPDCSALAPLPTNPSP